MASLEERCASLKATIDQLNLALERAASGEGDLKVEIQELRRTLLDTSTTSQSSSEKLKQVIIYTLICDTYFLFSLPCKLSTIKSCIKDDIVIKTTKFFVIKL